MTTTYRPVDENDADDTSRELACSMVIGIWGVGLFHPLNCKIFS